MKNNIANLKTCLFCAKNYKEQKDIRWEEFVETMHEIEKIFIKYFQNESRKYAEEVENHFLDFTAVDKTTKIHKLSFEDFTENLKNLLAKAHFLWQKFLSKMLGKNFDGFYLENAEAVEYANNHAWELISGIDETTKKTIQSILANAFASSWSKTETISAIQKEFEEFGKVRASLIAQMETALAHEHGEAVRFAKFAEEAGVKGWKRSQTQQDKKTRRSHLVNEIDGWIENDKLFSGTSTLHAPHGFRCRCVTIRRLFEPSIDEKLEVHFGKVDLPTLTNEQKEVILEQTEDIRRQVPYLPKLSEINEISEEKTSWSYLDKARILSINPKYILTENYGEKTRQILAHEFWHAIEDYIANSKDIYFQKLHKKYIDFWDEQLKKIHTMDYWLWWYPQWVLKWVYYPEIEDKKQRWEYARSEFFAKLIEYRFMGVKAIYDNEEFQNFLKNFLDYNFL